MRGFVSIVLVIAMLLFLAKDLKVYNQVYSGVQEIRNQIVLRQEVNEAIYELENGFRLTVSEALETLPKVPHSEKGEIAARGYVCARIHEWFNGYNYSFYVGYIDPNDYSKAPSVSMLDSCLNFLYVNLKQRKAQIKDNGMIEFPYSLIGYRIAFMFEGEIYGVKFKAIIPEGVGIS